MKNNYAYGSLDPYLDVAALELPWKAGAAFTREAPLDVEIGFGTGEYLVKIAGQEPGVNFLGFEQASKRIIKTLRKIHGAGLQNVRVLDLDAVRGFEYLLAPGSVRKVHCLFPCPWPKKKHAKHRLFQRSVLRLINNRLIPGGTLRIVTDQRPYAEWIREHVPDTGFRCEPSIVGPTYQTKFEKKWQAAGQNEFYALDLFKESHIDLPQQEREPVRSYFVKTFHPEKIVFEDLKGPVTIKFDEFLFDPLKKKGMVHALVTEDRKIQRLWIMIAHTSKGWCVSCAPATAVLPTEGIQKAIARVKDAVEQSAK